MNAAYHITTTVLPGHKIEVATPELPEGQQVQVVIISSAPPVAKREPSALDIIESLKGHRLFRSPEEVDRHIEEERNSWDR